MYTYEGGDLEGVSIVDYGLTLNVTRGKATVEYNDLVGEFYETLTNGHITGRLGSVELSQEQLTWLDGSKTWVKHQLDDVQ